MKNEMPKSERRVTVYLSDNNAHNEKFRYLRQTGQFSDLVNRLLYEYDATGSLSGNSVVAELLEENRKLNAALDEMMVLVAESAKAAMLTANIMHNSGMYRDVVNKAIDCTQSDATDLIATMATTGEDFHPHYLRRIDDRIVATQSTIKHYFDRNGNNTVKKLSDLEPEPKPELEPEQRPVIHASLADLVRLGNPPRNNNG